MPTLNNIILSFDKLKKEKDQLDQLSEKQEQNKDELQEDNDELQVDKDECQVSYVQEDQEEKNIYLYDSDEDAKKNN